MSQNFWALDGRPILQPGQFIFPFSFQIPFNLPPSVFHKNGDCRIDYRLRAQFLPHLPNDWVDPDATLSCLRSNDFYVEVCRNLDPIIIRPDLFYSYSLTTEAHAFLGMGSVTKTQTNFVFKQAMAYQGGKLECRIVCDNTKCKKDVAMFVFKWYCLTTNRGMLEYGQFELNGHVQKSPKLLGIEFPGVQSGKACDTVVQLDVPKTSVPSVHVSLFTVGYLLKMQTVHDIFGKIFIDEKAVYHNVAV